jgi:hypothetical protein
MMVAVNLNGGEFPNGAVVRKPLIFQLGGKVP